MRLLLTGAWAEARAHMQALEDRGHQVRFLQQEAEPLPCPADWVEGVVCNGLFLHHPLESFPNLRYIQLTSAGLDRVDLNQIRARDIRLFSARGVYSVPMAEFALGGLLQLCKQSRFFLENQRAHRWEKHRGLRELWGADALILGCGSVGGECARRLEAFGCRVRGIDLYPRQDPLYEEILPLSALETQLPQADILILTLPLTPETRGLLNGARLAALKPGALLVNIARGGLVDQDALVQALERGPLGGAVLDVFETEPLAADSPLWDLDNVILSPHNSFVGSGNAGRLSRLILENLDREAKL